MQYNSHTHGYLIEDMEIGNSKIPKDFSLRLFHYSDTQYQIIWCGNILNLDKTLFVEYNLPVVFMSGASD